MKKVRKNYIKSYLINLKKNKIIKVLCQREIVIDWFRMQSVFEISSQKRLQESFINVTRSTLDR